MTADEIKRVREAAERVLKKIRNGPDYEKPEASLLSFEDDCLLLARFALGETKMLEQAVELLRDRPCYRAECEPGWLCDYCEAIAEFLAAYDKSK